MRKFLALMIILITATISIPVQAKETFAERCQRRQRETYAKALSELQADGNLTQDAIDALGGTGMKPNKVTKKNDQTNTGSASASSEARGWVYSVDEMHITGLPTGEDGYTLAGDYGTIPQ